MYWFKCGKSTHISFLECLLEKLWETVLLHLSVKLCGHSLVQSGTVFMSGPSVVLMCNFLTGARQNRNWPKTYLGWWQVIYIYTYTYICSNICDLFTFLEGPVIWFHWVPFRLKVRGLIAHTLHWEAVFIT